MAIAIDGTGTITGISVGGLNDSIITSSELANGAVTAAKIGYAGAILQVVQTSYSTAASTTSVIPVDSTIPQNTEGTEILSTSITPSSSANKLFIQVSLPFLDAGTGVSIFAALFQDSTADALAGGVDVISDANYSGNISFTHYMTAGTTSSTTFKVRYGTSSDTAYINRRQSGATYGGITAARLIITEIAG